MSPVLLQLYMHVRRALQLRRQPCRPFIIACGHDSYTYDNKHQLW